MKNLSTNELSDLLVSINARISQFQQDSRAYPEEKKKNDKEISDLMKLYNKIHKEYSKGGQ